MKVVGNTPSDSNEVDLELQGLDKKASELYDMIATYRYREVYLRFFARFLFLTLID